MRTMAEPGPIEGGYTGTANHENAPVGTGAEAPARQIPCMDRRDVRGRRNGKERQ